MLVDPTFLPLVKDPARPKKAGSRPRVERKTRTGDRPGQGRSRTYSPGSLKGKQGRDRGELDRYL